MHDVCLIFNVNDVQPYTSQAVNTEDKDGWTVRVFAAFLSTQIALASKIGHKRTRPLSSIVCVLTACVLNKCQCKEATVISL